jgi:hypothetical protein
MLDFERGFFFNYRILRELFKTGLPENKNSRPKSADLRS